MKSIYKAEFDKLDFRIQERIEEHFESYDNIKNILYYKNQKKLEKRLNYYNYTLIKPKTN